MLAQNANYIYRMIHSSANQFVKSLCKTKNQNVWTLYHGHHQISWWKLCWYFALIHIYYHCVCCVFDFWRPFPFSPCLLDLSLSDCPSSALPHLVSQQPQPFKEQWVWNRANKAIVQVDEASGNKTSPFSSEDCLWACVAQWIEDSGDFHGGHSCLKC